MGGAPTNASVGSVAFSGASSVSVAPFTSGVPSASTSIASRATATSSSKAGGAPMVTGAVGAAALFGGAAFLANL
jgi:hypothetical protein